MAWVTGPGRLPSPWPDKGGALPDWGNKGVRVLWAWVAIDVAPVRGWSGPRGGANTGAGRCAVARTDIQSRHSRACQSVRYTMVLEERKTAVFQVRMRPSVKAAAEKAAADDNRSLAALMELLVIEHLKAKGYLK